MNKRLNARSEAWKKHFLERPDLVISGNERYARWLNFGDYAYSFTDCQTGLVSVHIDDLNGYIKSEAPDLSSVSGWFQQVGFVKESFTGLLSFL